ncbi:MAG: hypothetical protein LC751_07150, partial [Actinobacteria bacterium]|nr:hypothetical protein [Actinomycetota bacterium]
EALSQVGLQTVQAIGDASQQGAESANQSAQESAQAGEQVAQEANQAAQDTETSNRRRRGSRSQSSS